eukprot:5410215-Pyramimonas_sp.AAC.1
MRPPVAGCGLHSMASHRDVAAAGHTAWCHSAVSPLRATQRGIAAWCRSVVSTLAGYTPWRHSV